MPEWFTIQNKADASEKPKTEILIYDRIGKDYLSETGVDARAFNQELKEIPAGQEIEVHLNSPGGNVWDGLAIYHTLSARRDDVVCIVDGVAASIASVIALAGRELRMPANSMMMIHDPSGIAFDCTAEEMRQMAEKLDKHADVLADIYARKTGKTRAQMRALMRDETWLSGLECKELGFADVVTDEVKMAASLGRVFGQIPRTKPAIESGENTTHTMERSKIIAMLKKAGETVANDATDEQLLAQLGKALAKQPTAAAPPAPAPVPAAQPQAGTDDIRLVRAELDRLKQTAETERVKRITVEFNQIVALHPHLDQEAWLPRVLADESLMAELRNMPVFAVGTEPIRTTAQVLGNPLLEEYRKMKAGQPRAEFRIENFGELQRIQRQFLQPQAVNTIAAALVPDFLADAIIVAAFNKLAPLRGFSRDFGVDVLAPKKTVQVRKASAASAALTNPTNFEQGDSTLDAIGVTVNQISKPFNLTNQELNQGHRLAHLAGINARVFADAISDVWTALLIAANYPTPLVIGAAASFDPADLPAIWEAAKNFPQRNLTLDGSHLSRLLPTDKFKFSFGDIGAFGFDSLSMQNRWTGAVVNTVGFVAGPDAIAVASGLPEELPAGEYLSRGTVVIEGLDLTVHICSWFARGGRVNWASYDVMFGAAKGDAGQGEILVTA